MAGVKAIKIFAGEENGYSKWYVFEYHTRLGFDEQNNYSRFVKFLLCRGLCWPKSK